MVRTKMSHRKTSGQDSMLLQPPLKISKSEPEDKKVVDKGVDDIAIVLDLDKVKEATKALPKIPKIKQEPGTADLSEDTKNDSAEEFLKV